MGKVFYLIETSDNEWNGSPKYITDNKEDAFAHVNDYADWYCSKGCCDVREVDNYFKTIKRYKFWQGKLKGTYNY